MSIIIRRVVALQVMCDEAHFLKNGEAQISQAVAGLASAKRRLLMSGELNVPA